MTTQSTNSLSDAEVGRLLQLDPLAIAENFTGVSYKDDEATALLGAVISMKAADIKNAALTARGDTTFFNMLDTYVSIITDLGFELVLDVPFAKKVHGTDDVRQEHQFIYAHRDGLLLVFDTYDSTQVNGGKVYYCWKPANDDRKHDILESGDWRFHDGKRLYWAGDHDCREALRFNITRLKDNGTFLAQWPLDNDIFLWLLHHGDTSVEGYDYKAINENRIELLPDWVRLMIGC